MPVRLLVSEANCDRSSYALKVKLARFDSSGPRGPTNAPRFCRTVMSSGGITSVGLRVSSASHTDAIADMLVMTRLAADCITAIWPALGLVPRLCFSSWPSTGSRVSSSHQLSPHATRIADCRLQHRRASLSIGCKRCFRQLALLQGVISSLDDSCTGDGDEGNQLGQQVFRTGCERQTWDHAREGDSNEHGRERRGRIGCRQL